MNFVIYCLLSICCLVQFGASTPLGNEPARNKHKGKKERAKDDMRLWQIKLRIESQRDIEKLTVVIDSLLSRIANCKCDFMLSLFYWIWSNERETFAELAVIIHETVQWGGKTRN